MSKKIASLMSCFGTELSQESLFVTKVNSVWFRTLGVMMIKRYSILFALGGTVLMGAGCQRAAKEGSTAISIQMPSSAAIFGEGPSAMSALPAGQKVCFGVSVTGPGINQLQASCSPTVGLVAGFVESGANVELSVPYGTDRNIDLYMYLMNAGESNPCPIMGQNLSGAALAQTYLVGSVSGIALQNEVETVSIPINFIGIDNNIAKHLQLPETCLPTVSNPVPSPGTTPSPSPGTSPSPSPGTIPGVAVFPSTKRISNAAGVSAGSGIRLSGRINGAAPGVVATAPGIKLYRK